MIGPATTYLFFSGIQDRVAVHYCMQVVREGSKTTQRGQEQMACVFVKHSVSTALAVN